MFRLLEDGDVRISEMAFDSLSLPLYTVPAGYAKLLIKVVKACQRHIEMSSYLSDRNVLFTGQSRGVDGKVDSSARGRAQADAQGRGDDGAGSEESIGN